MLIIDRFEGEWAVLEWNGEMFMLPRAFVPCCAKAGDVLSMELTIDQETTKARVEHIKALEERLFKK